MEGAGRVLGLHRGCRWFFSLPVSVGYLFGSALETPRGLMKAVTSLSVTKAACLPIAVPRSELGSGSMQLSTGSMDAVPCLPTVCAV